MKCKLKSLALCGFFEQAAQRITCCGQLGQRFVLSSPNSLAVSVACSHLKLSCSHSEVELTNRSKTTVSPS